MNVEAPYSCLKISNLKQILIKIQKIIKLYFISFLVKRTLRAIFWPPSDIIRCLPVSPKAV